MVKEQKENKMGVMPIPKLILNISLPMMISMLVQSLYNVFDSIFVSHVSESALTAVSLAFPIQLLMISLATGTGVGINSLLSRKLGEKDKESVNQTAMNGLFLAICTYLVTAICGYFLAPAFFRSQGFSSEISQMGISYVRIVTIFSFGMYGSITFQRLLQATGRSFYSMIAQLVGAIINIILDPLLIFGLLGLPKLGIKGAAIATVIAQIMAMTVALIFNLKKNSDIKFVFKKFKPSGPLIWKIYQVGLPSIILSSIGSVMIYCFNLILAGFSSTAVALFGIYFKLQSFIGMPVIGLTHGVVPIVAYNYGAKNKKRIMSTVKISVVFAVCIMTVGLLLFELFPGQLLSLFDASPEMIKMGIPALRIISISFLGAGIGMTFSSVFQALGNGLLSLMVSVIRQLAVLLPVAWLIAKYTQNLNLVWWAFPISEFFAVFMCFIFFKYIDRQVLQEI